MKTVRILGFVVIAIIVFFASTDVLRKFGETDDSIPRTYVGMNPVLVSVVQDKTLTQDSLYNYAESRKVPYKLDTISTYVTFDSFYTDYFIILTVPFLLFFLYGFVSLVGLLLDICRNKVLTKKNVRRMRMFVYSFVLFSAINELGEYIEYSQVVNEITLPAGYTIDAFGLKYPWILFMLLVLFVEIFAKAEKIKEENDLTI